jgi:Uncharacterised nucleotidyltransferase
MTTVAVMADSAERLLVGLILEAFPLGNREDSVSPRPETDDWAAIAEAAVRHGLAPLLYASLKGGERLNRVPPESAEQLRADHFRANVANMVAYRELAHLLDSLATEHIPVVLLKGSAVAVQLYPDSGLRPLKDLDLLILESQAASVLALLTRQGYSPLPEMTRGFERRFSGQQAYSRHGPNPAQVDLHWHLFVIAYYRKLIPIEWFWQRTTAIEIEGRCARVLAPEAQFIHLASHYSLHHNIDRLMWLYDLALLMHSQRGNMNWEEVLEAVRAFKLTNPVQSTTAQVKRWWGVSPPADIARRLETLSVGRYERLVFAVASRGESQARVILDGLDLPSNQAGLRFWVRHLFPTTSYMRSRYHISHGFLIPIYYVWRSAAGGYRIVRAMVAAASQDLVGRVRKSEK